MSALERYEASPNYDWQEYANCRTVDPETMFPELGDGATARAARLVCANCVVREPCLADALEHPEPYGYRAGLSPRALQALRQRTAGTRAEQREAALLARYETARSLRHSGKSLDEIARTLGYSSHAGVTGLLRKYDQEAAS